MADEIVLAEQTELTVLKALAYDRLAALEANENEVAAPMRAELQAINGRIQELITAAALTPSFTPDPEPVHNGRVTTPRARKKPATKGAPK